MGQYYFVSSALPVLSLETKPEISVSELKELYALNLSQQDLVKVDALLTLIDLNNLRSFWHENQLDERGTLSEKELEEALLVKEDLPQFILDYLDRYETTIDRLRYFPSLYVSLYAEMELKTEGFLKRYFAFEREVRLILTALRAKRYGKNLIRELQYEDPTDALVASILAQKDSAEYSPPAEYIQLQNVLIGNPNAQHKALIAYELQNIEEMEGKDPFSIGHLLGYMARLIRIESWYTTNRELGLSLIEELSKYG